MFPMIGNKANSGSLPAEWRKKAAEVSTAKRNKRRGGSPDDLSVPGLEPSQLQLPSRQSQRPITHLKIHKIFIFPRRAQDVSYYLRLNESQQ